MSAPVLVAPATGDPPSQPASLPPRRAPNASQPLPPSHSASLASVPAESLGERAPSCASGELAAPENLPPRSGTGQPVDVVEGGGLDPQLSNLPPPFRPASPMSIDDDSISQDSLLQDVDEKDAKDLSHLGKLRLEELSSHAVRHVWPADFPDDHRPQPSSHFPSKNPWPTASFTPVSGALDDPLESPQPTGFPLPSGRPRPIQTPSAIPDRYVFSGRPPQVNLCESSDVGLVYRR